MSVTFSQSQDRAFVQSQCRARQAGLAGVLQTVEHLEEFDNSQLHIFPPSYPGALIDSVNGLPWNTLNPFPPEIEPASFDQVGFGPLFAKRSWRPAHANISDGVLSTGANAFGSYTLTSPYEPYLPPVSGGQNYSGQLLFGSASYWDYAYQPNLQFPFGFICVPEAGRGRTKWSVHSTVFAVSAELTIRWPMVGPDPSVFPWDIGPLGISLKNFQLIHTLSQLSAGTWYEAPIVPDLRGPFWNGDRTQPTDGFGGMFTMPVFFETLEAWQTRTGISLALSGSQA